MKNRKAFPVIIAVVLVLATAASAYAVTSFTKVRNTFQTAADEGRTEEVSANEDFKFTSFDADALRCDPSGFSSSTGSGNISEEPEDSGFIPAEGEISSDPKINLYNKMLNSIDYFNCAALTVETSMLGSGVTTVEYQTDIDSGLAYQAVRTDGILLSETYSGNGNMILVSNEEKTYAQNYRPVYSRSDTSYIPLEKRIITGEDGIPCYRYRRNVTNCPLASYSLFPQELAFSYLKDFDKWGIEDSSATYLGRACVIIAGVPSPYIAEKHNIDSFTMVVDSATGVLLEFCGTLDGEISRYMTATECSFEGQLSIKQFEAADYQAYTEVSA